jgi:hypothetical protein
MADQTTYKATYKVISMDVSDFTYNDYNNIFKDKKENERQYLYKLFGFKSHLPIAIYKKTSNIDNTVNTVNTVNIVDNTINTVCNKYIGNTDKEIAVCPCKSEEEFNEKIKGLTFVRKIGEWTSIPDINEHNFNTRMHVYFYPFLKIDYKIKKIDKNKDNI